MQQLVGCCFLFMVIIKRYSQYVLFSIDLGPVFKFKPIYETSYIYNISYIRCSFMWFSRWTTPPLSHQAEWHWSRVAVVELVLKWRGNSDYMVAKARLQGGNWHFFSATKATPPPSPIVIINGWNRPYKWPVLINGWGYFAPVKWSYGPLLITGLLGPLC